MTSERPATNRAEPAFALFGAGDRAFASFLLDRIAADREGAIQRTLEQYARHFGDSRALSDVEFRLSIGEVLDSVIGTRAEKDAAPFIDRSRRLGETLAVRGVALPEFVMSLQFFEDACLASPGIEPNLRAHRAFDRLSHQLIAAVAVGFHRRRNGDTLALRASLERDVARLAPGSRTVFHGLVGRAPAMRRLFARIAAAAPRKTTVLLVGETGTGKELCARALHDLSERKAGPFVPVNCAAIPREILASELFGHRRGAFTGAVADARGLIAAAEHGTLFLDEVTEMGEEAQVALLRVLEQHAIRPVGATGERSVDVRFVAATNVDPEEAVKAGKLRADLFHRLTATTIEVPPLRERIEDLPHLVEYFLVRTAGAEGCAVPTLAPDALEVLEGYAWPGNVRELANCLESAMTFSRSERIEVGDLPERLLRPSARGSPAPTAPEVSPVGVATIRDSELDLIRRGLVAHGGNKSAAARALGISRKRLYAKLREMGIADEVEPKDA